MDKNRFGYITILVDDYDEAKKFYSGVLGMNVLADNAFGEDSRWLSLAFQNQSDIKIVFQKAITEREKQALGNQAGDHVLFTIETADCKKEYDRMKSKNVTFHGEPKTEPWGTEVVFEDLYGNLFDLIEVNKGL
jgi:catechol 2,3-dioxygenase-like lactoylglutathione lyase family enzyme